MRMRALGKTGLAVSEVGFGSGDNAGLLVKADRRTQTEAVSRALEAGVNYFDTSPDYGKGLAERNIAEILRDLGAIDQVVLCTKIELYANHIGHFEKAIEAGIDASLGRMGLDSVDVVMIHNSVAKSRPETWRGWMPTTVEEFTGPVREGLQRVLQQGKAKHVGFIQEIDEPEATEELYESGLYECINLMFNLSNPSCRARYTPNADVDCDYGGILDGAGKHGLGVAVVRPLAGGVLVDSMVDRGWEARHPLATGGAARAKMFEVALERAKKVAALREVTGLSLTELAYRFLFSQPEISVVVGGFSDISHLEDCLAAEAKGPLDAGLLEEIESRI